MSADRPSPGLAALLDAVQRGALTEGDRLTLARALRAASEGRSIAEIVEGGRRERRDELLRAMRDRFFAGLAPTAAAKKIAGFLDAYAVGSWRIDRAAASPPRAGTLKRAGYELLLLGAPPAWRTVHTALQRYPLSAANESTGELSP